ncbi:Predicted arabinose efflux permease, MFS family [Tistlia consotensis]|uniref:Predicted arabinose efflux permease, MFS family n=1 Tax=Tistlia consotensis USBA 355 TaxID=560819 RepID=A0A1Y6BLT8_9PROT|nr:MFS transporter [Tistlia consotensis]SMF17088.1 Predicted arabinose efflux permease, MFS family [Tistlia consotensis USBA 355]SNR40734.1 Predicted arabinose efflux permease, MFS family [Tistlia consotensis]
MRFLFVNLGHAYAHFFLLLYPAVVVVLQARGGGGYGELLLPSTVGFVCFAAGTLPAGWLGDSWSRPAMLALQFFLLGAGALLAGGRADAGLLLPGLALLGLGASIYHPVGLPLAAETGAADGHGVGRALGVNGVWGNLGVAAAPLLGVWLAGRWGWQSAFLLPGALSLATGLAFLPLCRRWSREPQRAQAPQDSGAAGIADARERRRITIFLLASSLIGGLVFASVTVALPEMLAEVSAEGSAEGSTLGAAGLASLIFALSAFAQLPAGRAVDRWGARRLVLLMALPQIALLVLLGLVGGPGGGWLAVPSLVLLVPLIFGEIPVYDSLAVRAAETRWRARFFAAIYLVSLGVSATAVPVVAWLHDAGSGFRPLFLLLAAAVFGVVLAALALLPAARPQAAAAMAQTKRARSI